MSTTWTWTNLLKTPDKPTQTPHEEICWFCTHLSVLCAKSEDPGQCSALSHSSLVCLRGGLEPPRSILWGCHHETVPASGLVITSMNKVMQWWWYYNFPLSLQKVGFRVEDLRRTYWTKQSVGPLLLLLCGPLSQRTFLVPPEQHPPQY